MSQDPASHRKDAAGVRAWSRRTSPRLPRAEGAGGAEVIPCPVRDITARERAEEGVRKLDGDLVSLVAEMKHRDREMIRLNRMNDLLHACATQEEAYEVIALLAGDLFVGQSGFLATLDSRDQRLETVARWGDEAASVPAFAPGDCWAMRGGQPHDVVDPRAGVVCRHFRDRPSRGCLCVPLTVHGETLGLLCVLRSPDDAALDPVKRQLAITMGEGIQLLLSNLRLREKLRGQATLDVVSGLYDRRYLDEALAHELHRAARRKSPLSIAMLDLDQLQRLNDTLGHEAGDTLLRELGGLLRKNLRKSDISCRSGGDGFVLVLPDSTLADARQRLERIRVLVKQLELRNGDQPLGRITVSAGVAEASPQGAAPSEMLRNVDEALHAAKQGGRDRVVEYQPRS